ncbi:hypothetical protein B0H34DRAFT_671312 [Crassisporium funariophilum]|nr:hypothetical protein B0H34DRAFT_671312 [Crassisporium funariophilum]
MDATATSASSNTNPLGQREKRKRDSPPLQPNETRTKIVEIVSGTVNGCLSELGYFPGLALKLKELESINEQYKLENVKLFQDNQRLVSMIKEQNEQLALISGPEAAKRGTIKALEAELKATRMQRDDLAKAQPGMNPMTLPQYAHLHQQCLMAYNSYRSCYAELQQVREQIQTQGLQQPTHMARWSGDMSRVSQSPTLMFASQKAGLGDMQRNQPQQTQMAVAHLQRRPSAPVVQAGEPRSRETSVVLTGQSPQPRDLLAAMANHARISQRNGGWTSTPTTPNPATPNSPMPMNPQTSTMSVDSYPAAYPRPSPTVPSPNVNSPLPSPFPIWPEGPSSITNSSTLPATAFTPPSSVQFVPQSAALIPTSAVPAVPFRSTDPTLPTSSVPNSDTLLIDATATAPNRTYQDQPKPLPNVRNPQVGETLISPSVLGSSSSLKVEDSKVFTATLGDAGFGSEGNAGPNSSLATSSEPENKSLKRNSMTLLESSSNSTEEPQKKARLDEPNPESTGGAVAVASENAMQVDAVEDNESDEEEVEVGPDGLRLVKDCIAGLFGEEEGGIRNCKLCAVRHDRGYLPEPPKPFVNATEDQLVDHCVKEHAEAWEALRNDV